MVRRETIALIMFVLLVLAAMGYYNARAPAETPRDEVLPRLALPSPTPTPTLGWWSDLPPIRPWMQEENTP